MRGWSWRVLCGADKLEVRSPGRFEELAAEADTPQNAIMADYLEIIERDLDRTFPHNERFSQVGGEGQLELRKVLRALAMANKELGYCQVSRRARATLTHPEHPPPLSALSPAPAPVPASPLHCTWRD